MQLRTPKHIRSIILSVSTCIRSLARCLMESFMVVASMIMGEAMADVKLRARPKWPRIPPCNAARQAGRPRCQLVEKCRLISRGLRVPAVPTTRLFPATTKPCGRKSIRLSNLLPTSGSTPSSHSGPFARTHANDCSTYMLNACVIRIC